MKIYSNCNFTALNLALLCFLSPALADDSQNEVTVVGESRAFLESDGAIIKLQLEASGSSASQAEKTIELEVGKIQKTKDLKVQIQNRSYSGGTSNPSQLTKGTPIKITASILLMLSDTSSVAGTIDQVLGLANSKIIEVSFKKNDKSQATKDAYSAAVLNAKQKAEYLTKSNGLELGPIKEISVTEELPPSSIRDQLQTSPGETDSLPEEIRVFANVRFSLENKNPSNKSQ